MSYNKFENPEVLFNDLKSKKNTITDELLQQIHENAAILASKYVASGQKSALKKLVYILNTIEKEKSLIDMGINTFVYKDDLDFYIDNNPDSEAKPIKIIELERYEREIPDEIVSVIEKTKDIFDELYVVYTDYTGKEEKRIEAEKRSTDPILFGVFMDTEERVCIDRFYYLGDWIDEYCDLTLDKLVYDMKFNHNIDVAKKIYTPKSMDELKTLVKQYKESSNTNISFNYNNISSLPKKTSFFNKIKTFFTK